MKKLFTAILSVCLIMALSVTAYASKIDQSSGSGSANVTVSTTIEPTYTVTIPANTSVTFNALSTSFGAISLDAAQLDPGYAVKVELSASGALKNSADSSKTIAYVINAGNAAFSEGLYRTAGDKTELTIDITQDAWNAAYAGSYSDTVVFTVSYVSATVS